MISKPTTEHYRLTCVDEVYLLASSLASRLPNSAQYVTAIYELLLNALEHGNLGIGFETKSDLLRTGQWSEEIHRRLALSDSDACYVSISLTQHHNHYQLAIRDQGIGFNWRNHMMRAAEHSEIHGRGLSIALGAKFDRLFYNELGNEVTCVIDYQPWVPTAAECQLMGWNAPLIAKRWAI